MEQLIKNLLQISAKLFEHLSTNPKSEDRDLFIEDIQEMLDQRGIIIEDLRAQGFTMDTSNKLHVTLAELDKGIRERLNKVLTVVKSDLKELQNSKKHEQQYANPYANIRTMDGMYYDKKK